MAAAQDGGILVSSTVRNLVVGSGIEFADRGTQKLKGVPGSWGSVRSDEPPLTEPLENV